jgi:ABC-type dipeptide/oligopeptide/nickel transport system ATPase component
LLIADEPTTALDVTVQAQVMTILRDMCRRRGTAVLLITHNMGLVAQYAHQVAVMYAGRMVEQGPVSEVLSLPDFDSATKKPNDLNVIFNFLVFF